LELGFCIGNICRIVLPDLWIEFRDWTVKQQLSQLGFSRVAGRCRERGLFHSDLQKIEACNADVELTIFDDAGMIAGPEYMTTKEITTGCLNK
jgi:hypothetical protein